MSQKEIDRCKNFFALGLVYWLYGRDMEPTIRFLNEKFATKPEIVEANTRALKAGWNYGETTDAFASTYKVEKAKLPPGTYKNISGNTAMAWGLMTAAHLSGKELFLGSYPITPASDILHELSKFKNYGVPRCARRSAPLTAGTCRSRLRAARALPSRAKRSAWRSCWNCRC